MMSDTQHSDAGPTEEQPVPPHVPHSATQQTCPSADSIPGMLPVHTSEKGVKQNGGRDELSLAPSQRASKPLVLYVVTPGGTTAVSPAMNGARCCAEAREPSSARPLKKA